MSLFKFFKERNKIWWWERYRELNLCNGEILFIADDEEDMIEITYADGMLIDVGKDLTNQYCITVVSSNDEAGWKNPLFEVKVADKEELVEKIQETILGFRWV